MKSRKYYSLILITLFVLALQACGGGGGGGVVAVPTGAATVSVTDAPGDFDHVYITVKDVWFHESDVADPRAGDWLKYPLTTPVTIDLLSLSNGNMQAIWSNIQLPIGTYRQIRVFLEPTYDSALPAGTYHNYVVIGGNTYPLFVPDFDHGITLIGAFNITFGGSLKLAIDFDAGEDIVEFHEGLDYVLKPRLAYFDLDNAGAIKGQISSSGSLTAPDFVIKAEKLVTDGTSTYHAIQRWTMPDASGNFILYPISAATKTYDIVVRGLGHQTVIIKGVPVARGTTPSTATDLGLITMMTATNPDFAVAGSIASPTGAWVQFYQTIPGAGEYPYEIRFRHFNPLYGGFKQTFALSADPVHVGTYISSGLVSALTTTNPVEGLGNFNAVAGAILYSRSTPTLVSAATTTVSFPTPLTVVSPYKGNSVTGLIVMNNPGKMNNTMDRGLLFAVHGGMIVNAIDVNGQMAMGGPYTLGNLPGGTPGTPLPGAFYGIDAVGWLSTAPTGTYRSIGIPQIVDLRTGNDTADIDMLPLW